MRPVTALALSFVGILIFHKLSKASTASRLNFIIQSVKISFQGLTPVIELLIGVQNPTNDFFTIKSLSGNVDVNGNAAGNVSMFTSTTISANSQTSLPLTIRLSIAEIADQIIEIIRGGAGVAAKIHLDGTINVDGTLLPLDLTYKII